MSHFSYKKLQNLVPKVDFALRNKKKAKYLVDNKMFACVLNPGIVSLTYWNDVGPTKGIDLDTDMWNKFKSIHSSVEDFEPSLKDMVLCDDPHDNQQGFWDCNFCNPVNHFDG